MKYFLHVLLIFWAFLWLLIPSISNAAIGFTSSISIETSNKKPSLEVKIPGVKILKMNGRAEYKKFALIIGNRNYAHAIDVNNASNDANDLGNVFSSLGFETWVGIDQSSSNFRTLLRQFSRAAKNSDIAVFYYAGHAIQFDGRNYIIPVDSELENATDISFEAMTIDSVVRLLEGASSSNILFLDACRNNPFESSTRGIKSALDGGLAQVQARAGTMINYATAPGQVALDGSGRNSPFAKALIKHLRTPGVPLEVVMLRVRLDVAESTDYQQIPWTHSSLLREITLVPGIYLAVGEEKPKTGRQDGALVKFLKGADVVKVNGVELNKNVQQSNEALKFLKNGFNVIRANGRRLKIWLEQNTLKQFRAEYSQSFAILVAIDQYPKKTGFRELGFMEENADKLAVQLQKLGFEEENILKIYGANATKQNIEHALSKFWGYKKKGEVNRVIFYYGGHGHHLSRQNTDGSDSFVNDGLLIPYNFDPEKPYRTAIVLEELRNRNLKRSLMHHTLLLIDACSSGLALPKFAGDIGSKKIALTGPQRLRKIEANLRDTHSAIIVAGTGEERALWINGGIFTKSLIESLKGAADINDDGLIQYEELTLTLHEMVRSTSQEEGISQTPSDFDFGAGRILFEVPVR